MSAAILAIFLGVFGVHKFYLGQKTWGFVYIALNVFSFGILSILLSIISLIEGIMYLVQPTEIFNERFNAQAKDYEFKPNKNIAALLALSLGLLGLHKFYLKQKAQGLAYLIFGFIVPIFVFLPMLYAGIIVMTVAGEPYNSSNTSPVGTILLISGYLGLIVFIGTAQLIATIEGALMLFKSQESFDQIHKV
jgi:TM2 domain-containing membrane protein YozV